MLYSWRFSRYSTPIHWLDHCHMTSNNETVSRQMPWTDNIAKTMTSNGKQFTVTREMLTAVARDRWNFSAVFKCCFCFVLLYNKSLNGWSLGEQWILFPSNLNVPSTLSRETLRFSGNKIHCSPQDQSLNVYYYHVFWKAHCKALAKQSSIWPNNTQHVATGCKRWPNTHNMFWPTILQHVVLKCCDGLAGT